MSSETTYTWNASDYAKHSSAQQKWARELITKLRLEGNETVLDIGCGDGKVTVEIAGQVPDGMVVGIDTSSQMLDLANSTFTKKNHHNLSFELGDARTLQYENQFDVIFSNAVLHWISDHKPVIRGMQRSLKPGGRMLLQMGGKGNAASILRALEEIMAEEKWNNFFQGYQFPYGFYGPDEYSQWLTEEGLTPLRVELLEKEMSYPDKQGLEGWIRTTWLPYTERVPEKMRVQFISELADRYYDLYPPDNEGHIHVGMVRLEVEAVKAISNPNLSY